MCSFWVCFAFVLQANPRFGVRAPDASAAQHTDQENILNIFFFRVVSPLHGPVVWIQNKQNRSSFVPFLAAMVPLDQRSTQAAWQTEATTKIRLL